MAADNKRTKREQWAGGAVVLLAAAVALASARPFAGGWNDGSRLATVESLVDHHTLAIDRSVFVQPWRVPVGAPPPYPDDEPVLRVAGTFDKLSVNGHFYSDKSPVPALLLAVVYRGWRAVGGPAAAERPDWFCYLLTVCSSGLAYVAAVWCVFRLGRVLALPLGVRAVACAGFGLATVALPYARHVNNHILLLGVCAALVLTLARLAEAARHGLPTRGLLLLAGSLTGFGYTIDLGIGPVLVLATTVLVGYRGRCLEALLLFGLAAAPWAALHHAVNFAVGGTWVPANAVPAYLQWPGSPFTPETMTGGWKHPDVLSFLRYSLGLFLDRRGFLWHNLPVLLIVPAGWWVLRRRPCEWPEAVYAVALAGGVWLMYALQSNNASGQCCSVRWFVPLLAPGFYLVLLPLRDEPRFRADLVILTVWGALLGGIMWVHGPWMKMRTPGLWLVVGAALVSWGGYRWWARRAAAADRTATDHRGPTAAAA